MPGLLARLDTLSTLMDAQLGRLGDRGRLVLRYSGTESLARVMIEGPDLAAIERLASVGWSTASTVPSARYIWERFSARIAVNGLVKFIDSVGNQRRT